MRYFIFIKYIRMNLILKNSYTLLSLNLFIACKSNEFVFAELFKFWKLSEFFI